MDLLIKTHNTTTFWNAYTIFHFYKQYHILFYVLKQERI